MKYRFGTKPYPSQKKGLLHLWRRRGGALFWEPGTGKTKTALDFVCAMYEAGLACKVLVLCPINALQVWERQAELHIPSRIKWVMIVPDGTVLEKAAAIDEFQRGESLQFVVVNYDAIIKRDRAWKIMSSLQAYNADILICDESQKVKNATAKRSKAAHLLGKQAKHVVLMSGTPISKNYLDLYSQLKVLDEQTWWDSYKNKVMSWTEFRLRYGMWGGRSGYELRGYINLDDLQARYKPLVSTARRRSNLPQATDSIIPVAMNREARQAYDAFAEEGLVVWRSRLIEAPIPLTKLLRLQQMTGGAVHDETGKLVEFQSDKMAVLIGTIDEFLEAGRKHVVFARFKWEMDTIAATSKGKVLQIRGGVSNQSRKKIVREFIQSEEPLTLIIQIAAAEALDGLQHVCSDGIFYSTDYSWDHYSQARGRLDREGQKEPVVFWHLQVKGTVDKLIYRALLDKKDLEKMVIDDPDLLVVAPD